MSDPADLLPPELTVDDEPLTLEQLDSALPVSPAEVHARLGAWAEDDPAGYRDDIAAVMRFAIHDDNLAEWAMAHVAQIDTEVAAADERLAGMLARLQAWHADETRRLAVRRQFFEAHLVRYAREYRERDPKRNKTLRLVNGEVRSTARAERPHVLDGDAVVAWAKEHDLADVVRVREDVVAAEFVKAVRIGQRPTAVVLALDCGHVVTEPAVTDDGELAAVWALAVGDTHECDQCEPDPIDGAPSHVVLDIAEDHEAVVFGPDDMPVPGAEVAPAHVSFKVVPG